MQTEIRPEWLLRVANDLAAAGSDGSAGTRSADLRRSVSSAYYALFHRLALETARSALPSAAPGEIYGLARHVSHTAVRQIASVVTCGKAPRYLERTITRLQASADLVEVAKLFLKLQKHREEADYNHLAIFVAHHVRSIAREADRAVELIRKSADTDDFQAFFGLIALRTAIANRN